MSLDPQLEPLRDALLARKGTVEEFPFGPEAMVFKVAGKMFALIAWEEDPLRISLKCDPERALELREAHDAIIPGYHFNKRHWNTIMLDRSLADELVHELIDHSYDLVVAGLSRAQRDALGEIQP
ncbi:MAG: MmcQ/YjbR family DNA-binding protein [bacterium]